LGHVREQFKILLSALLLTGEIRMASIDGHGVL